MRWFTLLLTFFIAGELKAQGRNALSDILFQLQLQEEIRNPRKPRPFNAQEECLKIFTNSKKYWDQTHQQKNKKLILEGGMDRSFNREQIEKMKFEHMHGLKSKVRGHDQFITGGFSYGSSPVFPHTRPGCEKAFKEEVRIVDIKNSKCREIKFSLEEAPSAVYFQLYCQDSKNIWINFDPTNEFDPQDLFGESNDCIHCKN